MAVVFKNNAKTTLASGINSSVTSISVSAGSLLPSLTGSDFFFATIDDGTKNEIVKVTARSSNTLTVVRAQDNTTAQSFSTGAVVELRLTAAILELFSQTGVAITDEIEAYLDANGLTFPDDTQAKFGTDNDLTIDHNSSTGNSRIIDNSGILNIQQSSDDGQIRFQCDDGSGGVTTYYQISGAGETNTFFKDIKLGDNVKALFGTSNDFQIYHSSFDTYLSNSTGHLVLQNQANDKDIVLQTDNGSGGTADYLRLVGAHTRMLASQHIRIADTKQLQLGDDNDFSANFNGNHTFLTNNTGILYLTQNVDDGVIRIRNDDGSGGVTDYINLHGGTGEVRLSHYGTVKLKTITNGVDVPSGGLFVGGTEVITSARNLTNIGTISSGAITTSNILTVDYTAPIIRLKPDNGAFFQLRANESPARLEVGHSSNTNLHLSNTGNATFNFDLNVVSNFKINGTTVIDSSRNLTNIGTISSGAITSSGNVTFNGGFNKFTGDVEIEHNPLILDTNPGSTYGVSEALRIDDTGATTDRQLQIYELLHSGGRSHRIAFNTQITTDGSSAYTYTQGNYGGSSQIEFANNGGLIFYTVNQQSGGSATAITPIERFRINEDGDVRFESGNVFYDASQNALNFIDNVPAQFGAANDLQILHNGTDSAINNVTGDLYITNKADDKDILFRSDDGSGGFTTYFKVDGSEVRTEFAKDTRHTDNVKAMFGGGNDLQIYHNGSNSYIDDTGTGNLFIRSNEIRLNKYTGEFMIRAIADGAVTLYHDNSAKIATTSTGIDVTGSVTATTFSGALSGTIASATTATTQSAGDNSTKVATTAYTDTAIANLADSAPSTLNTLNELAAALGDDANFSTTVTNSIATKLPLAGGTMTGDLNMGSQNLINTQNIRNNDIDFIVQDTTDSVTNFIWRDHSASKLYLGTADAKVELRSNLNLQSGHNIQMNGTAVMSSGRALTNITGFSGTSTTNNGYDFNCTDSTGDAAFTGMMIDHNVSGTDTLTADRTHRALYIDQDSSATGGDTSNEHRLYAAQIVSTATGDSDLVYAVNAQARAQHSSGTISAVRGINAVGVADTTSTASQIIGVTATAQKTIGGTVNSLYGVFGKSHILSTNTTTNSMSAFGVYGEVELDSDTTLTNADAVRAVIDRDAGTITNGYLFRGSYEGTRPTNAFGVYIASDVVNYFAGSVSIGHNTPDQNGLNVHMADAEVVINDTNNTPVLRLRESGTTKSVITTSLGALTLSSGGATVALTLDTSQNATFAGTISSGQINATTSSDATAAIIATNTGGVSSIIQRWVGDSDALDVRCIGTGDYQISNSEQTNGIDFYDGTGGLAFRYNNAIVAQINSLGGFNLATGSYKVNGTTVIDSSRNLTNIGTISSGAITSSGLLTGNRLNINNSTAPYIIFTEGSNQVHVGVDGGSFWIRQNGLGGGSELQINSDGTLLVNHDATFAGTISSGAITSTGGITSSSSGFIEHRVDQTDSGLVRMGVSSGSAEAFIIAGNTGGNHVSSAPVIKFMLDTDGGSLVEEVRIDAAGLDIKNGALDIAGTTVIDSSRALQNVTFTNSILPTQLKNNHLMAGSNAILRMQETDVTNTPTWWTVADGGTWSVRLNNTGTYPISIATNSDNNAVSQINIGYNTIFAGTISSGGITSSGVVTATSASGHRFGRLTLRDDSIEEQQTNTDTATVAISYNGYAGGTTKFRDFAIFDGKQQAVARFDGSDKTLNVVSGYQLNGTTVIDGSRNFTNIGTISSGAITATASSTIGGSDNISMTGGSLGQLRIAGAGYTGAIALDANAMHIYHNSSGRNLVFGTNETARLTINAGGTMTFHSNNLQSIGTINSGAITASGDITSSDRITSKEASGGFYKLHTDGTFRAAFHDNNDVTSIYADGDGSNPFITFNGGATHKTDIDGVLNLSGTNRAIKMDDTTIVDISRNLTNIGTISATHSAVALASQPANVAIFDSTGTDGVAQIRVQHLTASGAAALGAGIEFMVGDGTSGSNTKSSYIRQRGGGQTSLDYIADRNHYFYVDHHDDDLTGTTYSDRGTLALDIQESGDVKAFYNFNAVNGIQINGTEVISGGRNLTNIGTISSGGITTSQGNITIGVSGTPALILDDTGNAGGGAASGKITFKNTAGGAMGIGYTSNSTADSDMIISTNAGGTYGGYLGLAANAITDAQSDIILEPKTNVRIATGSIEMGTTVFIDQSRNLTNIGTVNAVKGIFTQTGGAFPLVTSTPYDYVAKFESTDAAAFIILEDNNSTNNGNRVGVSGDTMEFFTAASKVLSLSAGNDATFTGDVTAFSDERLKDNIQTLDGKKALQMRGVSYIRDGKEGSGVIAQEIEKIAPELVATANDEQGTKSVAYGNLVGYLIEAIKEQQDQIEYMKSEIKTLKEANNGNK